jgi:hypothetical protein
MPRRQLNGAAVRGEAGLLARWDRNGPIFGWHFWATAVYNACTSADTFPPTCKQTSPAFTIAFLLEP